MKIIFSNHKNPFFPSDDEDFSWEKYHERQVCRDQLAGMFYFGVTMLTIIIVVCIIASKF